MAVKRSNPSAALATDQTDFSSQTTFPAALKRSSKKPNARPGPTGDDFKDGSVSSVSSGLPQPATIGRTVSDLVTERLDDPRIPISVAFIIGFLIKRPEAVTWVEFSVPLVIGGFLAVVWVVLTAFDSRTKPKRG